MGPQPPGDLEDGRPVQVVDGRVEPPCDVYEYRLVRLFVEQVEMRLRALQRARSLAGGGTAWVEPAYTRSTPGDIKSTSFPSGPTSPWRSGAPGSPSRS